MAMVFGPVKGASGYYYYCSAKAKHPRRCRQIRREVAYDDKSTLQSSVQCDFIKAACLDSHSSLGTGLTAANTQQRFASLDQCRCLRHVWLAAAAASQLPAIRPAGGVWSLVWRRMPLPASLLSSIQAALVVLTAAGTSYIPFRVGKRCPGPPQGSEVL